MQIKELVKRAHDCDNSNFVFNSGVYCIINIKTEKLYIGSAQNIKKRKREHFNYLKNNNHHSKHLQRSYNKYGKENFKFKTLLYCSINDLLFYEQRFIDNFNFENDLYNVLPTAGNNTGFKHSDATKEKMRKSSLGQIISDEARKKMSLARQNMSEETREKLRQNRIGKKSSEETKKKISEANKGEKNIWYGKKFSDDYKRKLSEGKMRSNNNSVRKPITAFDFYTNKIVGEFRSISECAKFLNINQSNVSRNLSGKYKKIKGYYFKFKNSGD